MEPTELGNGDIAKIRIDCIFTRPLFTPINNGLPAWMVIGFVMMPLEVTKLPVIFGKFTCVEKLLRKRRNFSRTGHVIPFLNYRIG